MAGKIERNFFKTLRKSLKTKRTKPKFTVNFSKAPCRGMRGFCCSDETQSADQVKEKPGKKKTNVINTTA